MAHNDTSGKSQRWQPGPGPAAAGRWAGRAGRPGHSVLLCHESLPGSGPRKLREPLLGVPRGSLAVLVSCWSFENLDSGHRVGIEMVLSCLTF